MSGELKDTLLIAAHDYRDAFRSRRLMVWLVLYLCVAICSTLIFTFALKLVEDQIADAISIQKSEKAGSVTKSIQKNPMFHKAVHEMIEDEEFADELLSYHPLTLFFGFFSFFCMPFLVIILCSDTIAKDVQSRYVRFNLFRTSRAAYAIGKTLSASSILLFALAISTFIVMIIGVLRLHSYDFLGSFPVMMGFMLKCWIFSIPFLGVALFASQLSKTPTKALFFGLVLLSFLMIIGVVADAKSGVGFARLWELGNLVTPITFSSGLWHPKLTVNLKAALSCIGLGIFYFSMGFVVFSRRDL